MPRSSKVVTKEGVNGSGNVRLGVWVSPNVKRRLAFRALEENRSVSSLVDALLRQALGDELQPEDPPAR